MSHKDLWVVVKFYSLKIKREDSSIKAFFMYKNLYKVVIVNNCQHDVGDP